MAGPGPSYTGRFAPTPSGKLHLGSLVAALGSFLDARQRGGRWLMRIEDLDAPRVVAGSAEEILRLLEAFGLLWDGAVVRQSERTELYHEALASLLSRGLTFACSCSRRAHAGVGGRYPGTCRNGPTRPGPTAVRFRVDDGASVCFDDRIQGRCEFRLGALGDVVVRRRDGLPAYQLAVVVDDAAQGVTDVVRGADLLSSTGWQIALARALGLPAVTYAHLPLVVEPDGRKLAKSRRSVPVDPRERGPWLLEALRLLNQAPPPALAREAAPTILAWGVAHWDIERLHGIRSVR
ncbi:MAG TPA: tRNA glutamyl-Q(34) synthetase GluQRS [Steroidobacteraceae bacterium]|nr:tRNA glutamyl-Q(34) synthetase GluQRS [Steroidobacteraceae bacterium]